MVLHNYFKDLNISESSKTTYNYSIKRLLKLSKSDDLKIINQPDAVDKLISDIVIKSRQIMYTSLVNYLKCNDPTNLKLIEIYQAKSSITQNTITAKLKEQKMDLVKSEAMIDTKDLKKVSKSIMKEIKLSEEGSKNHYKLCQYHLIVNLYLKIGCRLDIGQMSVVSPKQYTELNDDQQRGTNYLIISPKKKYLFQFNAFKNVRSIGPVQFTPDRYLVGLLNKWFKINKSTYLLTTLDRVGQLGRSGLGRILRVIFKVYLGKTKSSVNCIRHGMITESCKGQKSIKKLEVEASKFFHNNSTHQMYRNIDDN